MNSRSSWLLSVGVVALLGGAFGCAETVESGPGNSSGDVTANGGNGGNGQADGGGNGTGGHDPYECSPESSRPCENGGTQQCIGVTDGWVWGECSQPGPTGTPLVLVFDDAPVSFQVDATHTFDLTGMSSVATDWVSAATPWLALDRDGDGAIGGGEELFGSATKLSSGARAENGFVALRELDENHDGVLDARDPRFAELVMWSDKNGDRQSSPGELTRASSTILSIDLGYTVRPRCDQRGNCEMERASFRYLDAAGVERTGHVVDVHLALR